MARCCLDIQHIVQDLKALPRLPLENAKYVKRNSDLCWLGALGSLLQSSEVDLTKFTSFVLLTSKLRGPFFPAYIKVSQTRGKDQTWRFCV